MALTLNNNNNKQGFSLSLKQQTLKKPKRGLITDSIGDMLTRIRNACLAKKSSVSIPFTKMNQQIAQILEKEGFIQSYQTSLDAQTLIVRLKYRSKAIYRGSLLKKKESCITNLKRISKPGLRIYANSREIPRILGGTGIVIVSTPEGLMTDRIARLRGIGGELLCSVW
jgi:small subunit ribosomal protein S8